MNIFFYFEPYRNVSFSLLQTVEETQKPTVQQPDVIETTTVEEETVTIETQVMCLGFYHSFN